MKNNITTEDKVQKNVPGWGGKQKGLLQSLWEHGWIDPTRLNMTGQVKIAKNGV